MMLSIHKEGYIDEIVTKRKEQDIHKEVINIPIRYLLESIALG